MVSQRSVRISYTVGSRCFLVFDILMRLPGRVMVRKMNFAVESAELRPATMDGFLQNKLPEGDT